MQIEFTGIAARLKGNSVIELTATAPDDTEKRVSVPCEDIRDIYGVNCPQWMEENGDRESSLWELWQAVAGIGMAYAD